MATEKVIIEALQKNLFSQFDTTVYAILDGASIPDLQLPQLLWKLKPEHVCLYLGKLEPDMAEVAPYLIKLDYDHPFTKIVLEEGWGNHWGIFALAPQQIDIRQIRNHFRRFLMVINPEGKTVYFRYYDPRVLRVYLPTCNAEEMEMVFGPISCYILEDEDPAILLRLLGDDEKVRVEKTKLTQL
jgi:hypothetical protein